jgi:sodium-coupled neutral amino acid transporter 11
VTSFIFAIIGFVAFGYDVKANIFNSFPLTDVYVNIGRGLLGVSMFWTFPQAFYPARSVVNNILGYETQTRIPTDREHLLTTIGLFIPLLLCGIFIRDLGLVYQLVGGFCSTCLAYILPGVCYFLVFWYQKGFDYPGASKLKLEPDGDEDFGEEEEEEEEEADEDVSVIDEQERLIRQEYKTKLGSLGSEDEVLVSDTFSSSNLHANYGTMAANPSSSSAASTSSTVVASPQLTSTNKMKTGNDSTVSVPLKKRKQKTNLWFDIGAGALVIIGFFIMVLSTTITLRKMFNSL